MVYIIYYESILPFGNVFLLYTPSVSLPLIIPYPYLGPFGSQWRYQLAARRNARVSWTEYKRRSRSYLITKSVIGPV